MRQAAASMPGIAIVLPVNRSQAAWPAFDQVTPASIAANDNDRDGIFTSTGSTVSGNTADSNEGRGIVGFDSTIHGNTVSLNRESGIENARGAVLENTAVNNTGVGLNLGTGDFASGYANNVVRANDAGEVSGGIPIGINLCGDGACPQ